MKPFTKALRHPRFKDLALAFQAHIRIMAANERDHGVRLTAEEVAALALLDDAVMSAAQNALDSLEGS